MHPTPTLSQPKNAIQPVYEISEADKARVKRITEAWKEVKNSG